MLNDAMAKSIIKAGIKQEEDEDDIEVWDTGCSIYLCFRVVSFFCLRHENRDKLNILYLE
jgi:hypothetical protein